MCAFWLLASRIRDTTSHAKRNGGEKRAAEAVAIWTMCSARSHKSSNHIQFHVSEHLCSIRAENIETFAENDCIHSFVGHITTIISREHPMSIGKCSSSRQKHVSHMKMYPMVRRWCAQNNWNVFCEQRWWMGMCHVVLLNKQLGGVDWEYSAGNS